MMVHLDHYREISGKKLAFSQHTRVCFDGTPASSAKSASQLPDSRGWVILCRGGCPVPLRRSCSQIPGLYPLCGPWHLSPPLCSSDHQECPQALPDVRWGGKTVPSREPLFREFVLDSENVRIWMGRENVNPPLKQSLKKNYFDKVATWNNTAGRGVGRNAQHNQYQVLKI